MRTKQKLYKLTHSQRFLWWMVGVMIAAGLGLGGVIGLFGDDAVDPQGNEFPAVLERLSFPGLHALLGEGFADFDMDVNMLDELELSAQERSIAEAFLQSIQLLDTSKLPAEALVGLSQAEPPIRYANFALARFWELQGMQAKALAAYLKEAEFVDADESRSRVVDLFLELELWSGIERIIENPDYAQHIAPRVHYQLAINHRDWIEVAYWIVVMQFSTVQLVYVLMALVSGVAWMGFLLQAGQIGIRLNGSLLWMLLAFVSGLFSVFLTHGVIVVQEELYGFKWTDSGLLSGLLYFFFGVGLREELCKLICFLPFVPVLLRRRHDRLMMLMVPAAVGLGFAASENIFYYAGGLGAAAPARFLTANFFHIAATGLCGYAFCQIFIERRNGLNDFFATFAIVVAIHGLYNALLVLPELNGYGLFATAVYILMCYQFFQVLHQWRALGREPISLTSNFLFALSLVAAMVLCFQASVLGITGAIKMMYPELLGSALLVIMFIREIREPLNP